MNSTIWTVLSHFDLSEIQTIQPISTGNINQTFFVKTTHKQYALQKIHPIFSIDVQQNIQAVTTHVGSKGFPTTLLTKTKENALQVVLDQDIWRLMDWIEGTTYQKLHHPDMLYSAGERIGLFHSAIQDFQYTYSFTRPDAHNTKKHLQNLENALSFHKNHPFYDSVAPIAEKTLGAFERLPSLLGLPHRHSHGDLKINNLIFDGDRAIALIDWDTVGLLPWPIELGDALRSFCNPYAEDDGEAVFELDHLDRFLAGYTKEAKTLWEKEEQEALLLGLQTICLELSARFLADALQERYFAHDPKRFDSASKHHWTRGKNQWSLYLDTVKKESFIDALVKRLFR